MVYELWGMSYELWVMVHGLCTIPILSNSETDCHLLQTPRVANSPPAPMPQAECHGGSYQASDLGVEGIGFSPRGALPVEGVGAAEHAVRARARADPPRREVRGEPRAGVEELGHVRNSRHVPARHVRGKDSAFLISSLLNEDDIVRLAVGLYALYRTVNHYRFFGEVLTTHGVIKLLHSFCRRALDHQASFRLLLP